MSLFVCQLEFPGVPKAVQSFRYTFGGRRYQPKEVIVWKKGIKTLAKSQYQGKPIHKNIPLEMDIVYEFLLPKSAKKAAREAVARGELIPKITKPDVTDNLNKGLADALAGIIYQQDQQVFDCHPRKWLSNRNMTTVIVRQWL